MRSEIMSDVFQAVGSSQIKLSEGFAVIQTSVVGPLPLF
jgi:hypothetical protein